MEYGKRSSLDKHRFKRMLLLCLVVLKGSAALTTELLHIEGKSNFVIRNIVFDTL